MVTLTRSRPIHVLGGALEPIDDGVVEAAARRDPVAMRAIYGTLAPRVVGYFQLRGADDPEGLTNDVFATIFSRFDGVSGGLAGLRTLLFSVAHARLVDDRRKRARTVTSVELDPRSDRRVTASAEELVMGRAESEELMRSLDVLTDEQRSVIALRILGELSIRETASAMNKSEASIKSLQTRALNALKNAFTGPESSIDADYVAAIEGGHIA